jgi:hypothetical protein
MSSKIDNIFLYWGRLECIWKQIDSSFVILK